jgi:hypothetical protein
MDSIGYYIHTVYSYDANNHDTGIVTTEKGKVASIVSKRYDEQGNMVLDRLWNSDSKFMDIRTYEYDGNHYLLIEHRRREGANKDYFVTHFKYDGHGNWIRKEQDYSGGEIVTRNIEY